MLLIFVIFFFSDIGQCFCPALIKSLKNSATDTDYLQQMKDHGRQIPALPTDRQFLDLSETCLYMINFGIGSFFEN